MSALKQFHMAPQMLTDAVSDVALSTTTCCFLSVRKEFTNIPI